MDYETGRAIFPVEQLLTTETTMTGNKKRKRVPISAAALMALQISAMEFGGIGAGRMSWPSGDSSNEWWPCCVIGHARFLDGEYGELEIALRSAGVSVMANDIAVCQAGGSRGRVTYEQWLDAIQDVLNVEFVPV